jgi:hypothetical protein
MDESTLSGLLGVYAGWQILLFVMAIVWFFLPFAIFGTKRRIDETNSRIDETNRWQERMWSELVAQTELLKSIDANEPSPLELTEIEAHPKAR